MPLYRCPKCDDPDNLSVTVSTSAKLLQSPDHDNFETDVVGDHEWDGHSIMWCGCGHSGVADDFLSAPEPERLEYSVCTACLVYIANGDEPEGDDDWDSGAVDDRMIAEKNGAEGDFVPGVMPTEDDPDGHGKQDFSSHRCELCNGLPGERHGVSLIFR